MGADSLRIRVPVGSHVDEDAKASCGEGDLGPTDKC